MAINRSLFALAVACAAFFSASLQAATTSSSFQVTSQVLDSCQVSASNLAFGTYEPSSATDRLASTTLTVTCTLLTPYTIGLDGGSHAASGQRQMASGSNTLRYGLYRDAARLNVFGAAADALGVAGMGTGNAESRTIYGAIPAGQNVAPAAYSDVVTITLDY